MICIEGLALDAYIRLTAACGTRIFKRVGSLTDGLYVYAYLNDKAIVKYNGDVWVDLGGNKDVIYKSEFFTITIQ